LQEGELVLACMRAGELYNYNLQIANVSDPKNKECTAFTFILRVKSTRGPGTKWSVDTFGYRGRRTIFACWHAHRDFLREVFAINPNAYVRTDIAVYKGEQDFKLKLPGTYYSLLGLHRVLPPPIGKRCNCKEIENE